MYGLREIPRTATFAWSPGPSSPHIATGTKAGAVDEGFSNDTQLEIWELDLGNAGRGRDLQPVASIDTDSRFNDIAWTKDNTADSRGIIAGALENGSLDLWNAGKLLGGHEDALMSRTSKHGGAIKALQFNAFRSELLATVGAKGELFISDLNNVGTPFRMGNAVARADDFECLDWNKKTAHIMVTGSSGGTMTVWDIKNKRESLTLNNLGRKPVSAVAWDPAKTTRLVTAIPNDTDPVILVWDLRNANAPERVLKGHDGGVLSLSWCQQDSDLMLSCGKDNRNICWNPQTGEPCGEFPVVTNWTFQTRWNPYDPDYMATASFDGKITVHPIQNTKTDENIQAGNSMQAVDDEDFFNKAQSQPQGTGFSLQKAPKWLQSPCGASFGFGGKIVSFKTNGIDGNKRSMVRISTYAIDEAVVSSSEFFEAALQQKDLSRICESRIAAAISEPEKADWTVIKTLTSNNTRKDILDHMGFSDPGDEAADGVSKLSVNGAASNASDERPMAKPNRLSGFFDNSAEGDNFLSELAATKGAKTNNPFHIYSGLESESDRRITRALLLGEYNKALDVCLEEDRMSDAFMIAICGGRACIEKTQKFYFNRKGDGPNYLRLLASIAGKNLWDLVYNADLQSWKDVMATLCTYADSKDFPDLCEALGDRLEEQMKASPGNINLQKDATFCFLVSSKLDKVVSIWLVELEEHERKSLQDQSKGSSFSIHARSLQNFIEKVTVFREVTQYQDQDQDQDRRSTTDWKLAALYERYIEYADISSAHGQLQIAERYLNLLPDTYPAADVAKARVQQATRKAPVQTTSKQPPNTGRPSQKAAHPVSNLRQQSTAAPTQPAQANPYTPSPAVYPPNPYAPTNGTSTGTSGYSNNAGYQQFQNQQPPGLGAYPNQPLAPPPRNVDPSPSIPPPSKAQTMSNWNDTPESFFKAPTSRRGTPGIGANGPSPYQPSLQPSAPSPSFGPPSNQATAIGPPPKGPTGAPPRTSSPSTHAFQSSQRSDRPSSAANTYAPPPSSLSVQQQSTIPRGPSPYNAPPSAPPPNNRYAPAQSAPSTQPEQSIPGQRPPPSNPYAPPSNFNPPQHQPTHQLPPSQNQPSMQPGPSPPAPLGPPQGSRPGTGQSQHKSTLPSPKYPAGDRSHIPSDARSIYEMLNNDMHRVKSRAPASFKAQVNDTEKRLNILFDHLNNEDLLKEDTIASMAELAQAIHDRAFEKAQAIHVDIMTNKTNECGNWMVGVKRLIAMSRATP